MEPAEAVAKVEQWLRAVHGPEMSEPGGVALRVDRDRVLRVPEGWAVPYNTVAYLDQGRDDQEIFPQPKLIVREPDGELRQAHPHPGGLSVPVTYPGEETWREIVDPEYAESGLGHLGVPKQAVAGWAKVGEDGRPTGEERENPEYTPGPIRRGFPRPENPLEYLLQFHGVGWLDRERLLIGLLACEFYAPLDLATGRTPRQYFHADRNELEVATAPRFLPPRLHGWWKMDASTLTSFQPPMSVAIKGPGVYEQVTAAELAGALAEFPRHTPQVDVHGRCPEAEADLARLAAETAAKLGLNEPVDPPLSAAEKARKRGYALTPAECELTVVGETWVRRSRQPDPPAWPEDLAAHGLAPGYDNQGRVEPRVDTFGKYFAVDLPGFRHGWQRVTGAYVGFAIGEALGAAVDTLSLAEIRAKFGERGVTDFETAFERPGQIGSLTQRLLFFTESVIRSPHREDPAAQERFAEVARGGLRRWLDTQGVPYDQADGWLVRVPGLWAQRHPEPAGLAGALDQPPNLTGPSALLPALPAALTEGGPGSGLTGGARQAVRLLAGLTHAEETDLAAAAFLADLFDRALTKDEFAFPAWALARQVAAEPGGEPVRNLVAEAVPNLKTKGLPRLRDPERIGDGQDTPSVLGRALAAVSGYENYPEKALLRAVNHSGRSALTGALAGALLGARLGIPGLPQRWVERLELRYLIETVATDAFWHFDRHSALGQRDDWRERYPGW
ncbi:ADP-ribosylglycohydrolase family protein [Amycolatopsis anabasis]|uniref:ADP-ribosylglycohydrolase family protein n=1 Tax=Amycolatopsis anabasis TaxID=1840409 RepID=UPI00131E7D3E|nr:ADP-ribosylglycohydrolase family protein [Amycolatopsis anabasis]